MNKTFRMKAMVTMAAILATIMLAHAQDSDAKRMQSEEMNPGSALGSRERTGDGAFKILIYGNSIALHGPAPKIGWDRNWGMAASAREKDFAHLVVADLEKRRGERADYRIRNLAALERNFTADLSDYPDLAAIKTPMPKNIKPKNITFIQGAQHSYVPPKPWQTGERRK